MIFSNKTKIAVLMLPASVSAIAAKWTVKEGIPYIGIAPLQWWQSALRWPWSVAIKFGAVTHPLATEIVLFAAYAVIIFTVAHYLVPKMVFAIGDHRASAS